MRANDRRKGIERLWRLAGRINGDTSARVEGMDRVGQAVGVVCRVYGVTCADLEGTSREWRVVWARWLAMMLVRRYTGFSWDQIGALFGRGGDAVRQAVVGVANEVETSCARGREVARVVEEFEQTSTEGPSGPPIEGNEGPA